MSKLPKCLAKTGNTRRVGEKFVFSQEWGYAYAVKVFLDEFRSIDREDTPARKKTSLIVHGPIPPNTNSASRITEMASC